MSEMILHNNIKVVSDSTSSYFDIGLDFIAIPEKTQIQINSISPSIRRIVYNNTTNDMMMADGIAWRKVKREYSFEREFEFAITTTNTNYVDIVNEPMVDGDVVMVYIHLFAKRQGTNEILLARYLSGAVKTAGVIAVRPVSAVTSETLVNNPAVSSSKLAESNYLFRVHSGTTQTINWRGVAKVWKANLP